MGGRGRGRGRGGRGRGGKRKGGDKQVDDGTGGNDPKRARYDDPSQFVNESFETYYRKQGILRDEEDFNQFMKCLRTSLPVCFRINPLSAASSRIHYRLKHEFHFKGYERGHKVGAGTTPVVSAGVTSSSDTSKTSAEEEDITRPFSLDWYPNGMAWQINMTRSDLKKNPVTKPFHQWLVTQTSVGNISRQEAVSMIPPLLLDVKSDHKVLDMCASPGSKTMQLLESLHTNGIDDDSMPTGLVIANDNESKRAYMLIHQCKRIGSNALAVTCHDGQRFPNLKEINADAGNSSTTGTLEEGVFERVLCDVPCSGDGTLRKSPDLWRRWDPILGLGVHKLQIQIALRGLELLKVGGLMVYSTCTFNPIEDEAVVKTILSRTEGAVEIVDCSDKLEGLKHREGLKSWKVIDQQMNEYTNYEEALSVAKESEEIFKNKKNEDENETREPKSRSAHRLLPTMFPPAAAEAERLNLNRCLRLMPQDSNTGGFFVCLLKKTKPLGNRSAAIVERPKELHEYKDIKEKASNGETVVPSDVSAAAGSLETKQQVRATGKSNEPLKGQEPEAEALTGRYELPKYMEAPKPLKLSIKQFYGLKDSFPIEELYVRESTSKKVYMVSESLSRLCLNGQQKGSLRLMSAGVPILVAPTSRTKKVTDESVNTDYLTIHRISSEGIHMVAPYVGARRVVTNTADFTTMLRRIGDFVPFNQYSKSFESTLESLTLGCFVAVLDADSENSYLDKPENAGATPACYRAKSTDGVSCVRPLMISCWKGVNRLNVMCRKDEAEMMLLAMIEMGWIKPTAEESQKFLLDQSSFNFETVSSSATNESATTNKV
eukprot:gb/GECG01001939.1/.p1 GENE.gb/GECG01001939.1/~~gb/GECG01001939.1/.p1  ORF type:complete len:830 (+),score=119.76 gb/GECG01001939.1/:1-2490(+)